MSRTDAETDNWPTTMTEETLVGRGTPPPAGYYPPPAPPPPGNRVGAGMLLGLVAALLIAAGLAAAWFFTHRDTKTQVTTVVVSTAPTTTQARVTTNSAKRVVVKKATVPRVIGMPVSDANAIFKRLGLKTVVTLVSSSKKAGTVVDQGPGANTKLAKGSFVTLAVAKASHPKSTTTTQATTTTPASTTTAQTTSTQTTTTPAATTTASTPAPQPTSATMPDVSSQTEAQAAQAMAAAGILPSLFFVPGSDPLGTVEQQAKPAGTKLGYHAHVQINISSGPGDKPKEQVPNVIGRTLQDAVSSLNAAHLRLIFVKLPVTTRSAAGKIVQQSPLGGNQAPQNAQVLVFLGAFKG
jgi:beta-lactam-binding protein with PASTA domain